MFRTILFTAILAGFTTCLRAADVSYVVNPQSTETSLSADDLKSILLGNKIKWDGGGVIKLAVLTAGPVHEQVMQERTQRSADQFDKYWKKLVFTGKGVLPTQAADDAAVIDYVAKTPGALGYVASTSVTAQVKVLAIK
jgi:ABC-type phosphate transport system substrate-binding protein